VGKVSGTFLRSRVGPQGSPNLFESQLPDHRVEIVEIEPAGMGPQNAPDVLCSAFGGSLSEPEQLADDRILGSCDPCGQARDNFEFERPAQATHIEGVACREREIHLKHQGPMNGIELPAAGVGLSCRIRADDEIGIECFDEAVS